MKKCDRKKYKIGCLILGRTNLSEWAYSLTTNVPSGFSAIGGQCLHPEDIHEDVSGSSSGSAAGVKRNLFTFSLGTETQGSLLSPANNVRNVCTLKPSLGTWPMEEIIPVNYDQDSCGPMARNIEDIGLLHRIVSGINEKSENDSRILRVGFLGKIHLEIKPFDDIYKRILESRKLVLISTNALSTERIFSFLDYFQYI